MISPALVKPLFFFVLLSILLWCGCLLAMHYVHSLTIEVLHSNGQAANWTSWVYDLYPRLQTEKWRFNESFFIEKTHQVLLRASLGIQTLITWYVFRSHITGPLHATYEHLAGLSIQRRYIPAITLLLYSCLLLVVYNAIIEFKDLSFFSAFYTPVGIGKLLLPLFPSTIVLWCIYGGLVAGIAATILLPKKWIAASIAAIAFIYYQLILFGFGKYDHGYSTLTIALLIYPFFLWEAEKSKKTVVPAWSIVLIQWMICLAYFYCGTEKLLISGIEWFSSDNLQQHLLIHETALGLKLASHEMLCKILSFGVVILQLSFVLLPFQKKLAYILLPAGFVFHTASWLLLDAGGLFNPWWGVYLFFLFPLQSQETKSDPI